MDAEVWDLNEAGRPRVRVRDVWDARELVGFFAWRDLKVRYKQAVLGVAWAVLQPLLAMALFTLVFRRVVPVGSDGLEYHVFALAGYVLWSYVAAATNLARTSLLGNGALLTRVYFPRLVLPVAALGPPLLDLGVGIAVLAVVATVAGATPGAAVATAPAVLVAAAAIAAGVGMLVGSLSVRFRDVQQAFGFAMQLWLFATPVVYPSGLVPERWQWLYHANPMVVVVEAWRWSTLGGPPPKGWAWLSLAMGVGVLLAGFLTFRRLERSFADVV